MKKLLATSLFVLSVFASHAMDNDSNVYVRADVGYGFDNVKISDDSYNSISAAYNKDIQSNQSLKGAFGDIGVGYKMSANFRTDITLNLTHMYKTHKDLMAFTTFGKGSDFDINKDKETRWENKAKKISIMLNGYYDIRNQSEFTPYLMAGIGINKSKIKSTVLQTEDNDNGNRYLEINSKNLTSFAYHVGVGVTYKMSEQLTLDLAYKAYGINGTYKLKDTVVSNAGLSEDYKFAKPKLSQQVKGGIRFAF